MAKKSRWSLTDKDRKALKDLMMQTALSQVASPRDRRIAARLILDMDRHELLDEKGTLTDPVIQVELIEVKKQPRTTLGE